MDPTQTSTTNQTITTQTKTVQDTTVQNTTSQTTTQSYTHCTPPDPEPAKPIIDTILADVNAVIPNFSSLVSSYRLLVGSAEEIHRIPDVCPDIFERAVRRFDNAGTLIDILLDLLCCKIKYSSDFLSISCVPIDLFRLFANRSEPCDQSHRTADEIITLEAVRQALANCLGYGPCFPDDPVVCPTSPPPSPTRADPQPKTNDTEETASPTAHKSAKSPPDRNSINESDTTTKSPLRRRHI